MLAFELDVDPGIIITISENTDYDAYFTRCKKELQLAKNTTLCDTSVTFFDLLTDVRHELVKYFETKYLVDDLRQCYKEKFPIYGESMFKNVIREVYGTFLWTQSAKELSNLLPVNYHPHIITDVLGHLQIKELEKFCSR